MPENGAKREASSAKISEACADLISVPNLRPIPAKFQDVVRESSSGAMAGKIRCTRP